MTRIVEGGEGVATFFQPEQMLFEWPPKRKQRGDGSPILSARRRTPAQSVVADGQTERAPDGYWMGEFVLTADVSWLRPDEAIEISALVRMRSGGEYLELFSVEIDPSQGRTLFQTRPLYSLFGCAFRARQTKGGGDARLPFWVMNVAGAPSGTVL